MTGLKQNKIELVIHDSDWKNQYIKEKELINEILSEYIVDIQHIGSTSIPQLKAKPIIDICVGILSFESIDQIISIMARNDYRFLPNHGSEDRYLFIKSDNGIVKYHIHIEKYLGNSWNNHIDFKKCLQKDVFVRTNYENIKLQLKKQYKNDRKMYLIGKSKFIEETLKEYRKKHVKN